MTGCASLIGVIVWHQCRRTGPEPSTLQSSKYLHTARPASGTVNTLAKIHTHVQPTDLTFLGISMKKADSVYVAQPCLHCRRKVSMQFDIDGRSDYFPTTACGIPSPARFIMRSLDSTVSTINAGFNQPGYAIDRGLDYLLLKSVHGEGAAIEFASVTSFYSDNFSAAHMSSQHNLFQWPKGCPSQACIKLPEGLFSCGGSSLLRSSLSTLLLMPLASAPSLPCVDSGPLVSTPSLPCVDDLHSERFV